MWMSGCRCKIMVQPNSSSNHEPKSNLAVETITYWRLWKICVQMCTVGCVQMSEWGFPHHIKQPVSVSGRMLTVSLSVHQIPSLLGKHAAVWGGWSHCWKHNPPNSPGPDSQSKPPFRRSVLPADNNEGYFLPQVASWTSFIQKLCDVELEWRASDLS